MRRWRISESYDYMGFHILPVNMPSWRRTQPEDLPAWIQCVGTGDWKPDFD